MRTLILALLSSCLLATAADSYDQTKQLAREHLAGGRLEKVIEILEPLSKKSPDDIDLFYTLAQAYRKSGKIDKAEVATQWMLDLRPEYLGGRYEAGLLREEFKDYRGAVDMLNDVYHRTPASKTKERRDVLVDLARIFDKQEMAKEAASLRKEIEKLNLRIENEKASAAAARQ